MEYGSFVLWANKHGAGRLLSSFPSFRPYRLYHCRRWAEYMYRRLNRRSKNAYASNNSKHFSSIICYALRSLFKLDVTCLHPMLINLFFTHASHPTNGTLKSAASGVSEIFSVLQYAAELNSFLQYDIIGCIEDFGVKLRIIVGICIWGIRRR